MTFKTTPEDTFRTWCPYCTMPSAGVHEPHCVFYRGARVKANQPNECPGCGKDVDPLWLYCPKCGMRLIGGD